MSFRSNSSLTIFEPELQARFHTELKPKTKPGSLDERTMDPHAREYFLGLLVLANKSIRLPSPDNPPDGASERAADE